MTCGRLGTHPSRKAGGFPLTPVGCSAAAPFRTGLALRAFSWILIRPRASTERGWAFSGRDARPPDARNSGGISPSGTVSNATGSVPAARLRREPAARGAHAGSPATCR